MKEHAKFVVIVTFEILIYKKYIKREINTKLLIVQLTIVIIKLFLFFC